MGKQAKIAIRQDLYRLYGKTSITFFEKIKMNKSLKLLILLRKFQFSTNVFYHFALRIRIRFVEQKTGNEIRPGTKIGSGLLLIHEGPRYISPLCVLGNNVDIMQGVTIGAEWRGKRVGAPVIGDKVWLGPFCIVTGKISIGSNVLIAGGAFVNFDVPDNSIVIGNPGKIYPSKNATYKYVENIV